MPPKAKKNILLMVINIGSTSLEQNSLDEEPFIDKAKYAMRILVEKKIFMQPKDEIGIITMGDETANPDDIDNVKLYCEHLLVPNWEMLSYINNLSSTNYPCNWIEALHVALGFLRREVINTDCRVFLVVFNNFKEDADSINQYDPGNITDDLKNYENVHLIFVGEKPINEQSQDQNLSASEKFALSIAKEIGAQYEQINNFIETRRFYMAPPVNSTPWKFDLEWAGLNIPCASFVKVTDAVKLGSWKIQSIVEAPDLLNTSLDQSQLDPLKSNTTNIVKERLNVDLHRNEINPEKIIYGYKFGGKYIPLSEEDEAAMKYSGSEKGMVVYGFVPQDEVKLEYWSGNGSRIIVPSSEEDSTTFYSFIQAMVEKQYVAIVRKTNAKNQLPKYGVLFPKVDDNEIWCLVHLELPFVHDLRIIQKKPIKSLDKNVDREKLEALDNYIDSMTITKSESQYLNVGMFPNVRNQYHWNAFADRAINPSKPLLPLDNYINEYLIPPQDLDINAKVHIEKLRKLFDLHDNSKDKDQKSMLVQKEENNSDGMPLKSISKNKNYSNERFFSPEDVDLKSDELENM